MSFNTRSRPLALLCALMVASLGFTGCGPAAAHPGQLSAVDGGFYDSFTVGHAALASLRTQIATSYPKYIVEFDDSAASYSAAYSTYVLFRNAPAQNQAQVTAEIANITVSIVALENAIQEGLHVPPATQAAIRAKALKIRQGVTAKAQANVSLQDVLTYMEIASAVAQTIPGASPYAALASVLIQATSSAVNALAAQSAQPIDMSTIAPILPITAAAAPASL